MKHWLFNLLLLQILLLLVVSGFSQSDNTDLPDSLVVLLQKNNKSDTNRIAALEKIINALFQEREYQKTKPYINEVVDLSEILESNYAKALADFYKGVVLLSEDNFNDAFPYLLSAKKLASILTESEKNLRLQILVYHSLSVCYFKQQKFKEFYENIQKGLDLNKKLQDASLEFVLKLKLAVTYLYLGKDSAAIEIDKGLISDPRFQDHNMYYPYFHLGAFNMELHKYDTALMYFTKAIKYASLPAEAAWVFLKKGVVFNNQGKYNEAISILSRCLDTLSVVGNAEIESNAYVEMGHSYYELSEFDTAMQLIDMGIEIAHENQNLEIEVEGLGRKTDILYDQEQYREFAKYILQYNILKDSLNMINNFNKLSDLVLQQKIKDEEEQARYKQYVMETKHRQQLLVFFIISLLLVSTIVVILLHLKGKNIHIKNKKIQEELLSNELDLRNREMTAKVLVQVQKKEILSDIIEKLNDIELNKEPLKSIHNIVIELKQSLKDNYSEDFDYYFVQTHPDFYTNLQTDFPNLTSYELRLCAYLKLNLSTKEIAAINNISIDSARVARTRLRKTLRLSNSNEKLVNFLSKY